MALRLIELYLPTSENLKWLREKLNEQPINGIWTERVSENQNHIQVLVSSENSGEVLDLLEKMFSNVEGFRIILLPVETTIPKIEEKKENGNQSSTEEKTEKKIGIGISRQELYSRISGNADANRFFIYLVIASSIVASVGILKNSVAVIVGAMVIAPLLGPNVALALATTLGDTGLLRRSIKSNITGSFIALIFSIALGYFLKVNPQIPELYSRTQVGLGDIVLALASGSAGALSYTMGLPSALIGVMVAVALLPPLVSCGMLFGSGHFALASGAFVLLMVNIICVNLAGVFTFLVQGVRPLTWWDAHRAKKSTKFAIMLWTILLIVLLIIIIQTKK